MPFMKWVKSPNGYEPAEITDEEVVAENARRRGKRAEIWLDEANEMVKREKEKKMEFDKSRVFTSLNADELRAGDKVIGGNTLADLKYKVGIETIDTILDEGETYRFTTKEGEKWLMVLLIERKENCTNCKYSNPHKNLLYCEDDNIPIYVGGEKLSVCDKYKPKTEQKADEVCINCEHYSTGYCNKYYKSTTIDPWHYPEKGDLPAETDKVLVVIKEHRIQADYIPPEAKVGRLKWNGKFFEFNHSDYFKDEIIKWMPIELTEEVK